jgi:hypothetical protein
MTWRRTIGSILVASVTGMMIYGLMVNTLGSVGGYLTVATGIGVGLFTDDALKRAREWSPWGNREEPPARRKSDRKSRSED